MLFFRVQPAGLGIAHFSETSVTWETGELADGLHVFTDACQLLGDPLRYYGDDAEIIVIDAPNFWDNGDAVGVCIDPDLAEIEDRYTIPGFLLAVINSPGSFDIDEEEISSFREALKDYVKDYE